MHERVRTDSKLTIVILFLIIILCIGIGIYFLFFDKKDWIKVKAYYEESNCEKKLLYSSCKFRKIRYTLIGDNPITLTGQNLDSISNKYYENKPGAIEILYNPKMITEISLAHHWNGWWALWGSSIISLFIFIYFYLFPTQEQRKKQREELLFDVPWTPYIPPKTSSEKTQQPVKEKGAVRMDALHPMRTEKEFLKL